MLSYLSRRLLLTLAYTDQFLFPLTTEELGLRLVGKRLVPKHELQGALLQLQQLKMIEQIEEFWHLAGRSDLIKTRVKRQQQARALQPAVDQCVALLKKIPWVQAVAVTGSLSMEVALADDDIDFMIITAPNTLWLTRLLVIGIATLKGRRRFWWEDQHSWSAHSSDKAVSKKVPTKWCFNLWLTTQTLSVPQPNRKLYTAYEVVQARFVYAKPGVEELFLQQNRWVRYFLTTYWHRRWLETKSKNEFSATSASPHFFRWGKGLLADLEKCWYPLDWIVFCLQRWYMRPHMTSEKVSRQMAYFHPRPTAHLVAEGWQKALQRLTVYRSSTS
jgi:hypothetical protein